MNVEPEVYSLWKHVKRECVVRIICVSTCQTNSDPGCGSRRDVVYMEIENLEIHHRELSEFIDGRFVPVCDNHGIHVFDYGE